MARLDGAKPNIGPYVAGLLLLAVLAAGAFYYFKSKGDQGSTTPNLATPSTEQRVESTPSANGDASANGTDNTTGNATPSGSDASATPASGDSASDNTAGAATTPAPNSEGSTGTSSTPAPSGTNAGSSNATTAVPGSTPAASGTQAPQVQATTNGVVAKRSKTITNHKTGTTVTYSKEVHKDGTITRDKKTGTVPIKP